MNAPQPRVRRAVPDDIESLLTTSSSLGHEIGTPYAIVTAYAANRSAQRFYERQGFGPHTVTLRMPLSE